MQRTLIILFALILSNLLKAQKVSDIYFYSNDREIYISYDLLGAKFNQTFNVSVYVSTDAGKAFYGPLEKVQGDVGLNVTPGKNRKIYWEVFEEMPDFDGEIVFEVRAVVNEEKIKRQYYVGYKASYLAPLGLIAGTYSKVGFYTSVRVNPEWFTINSAYETDGNTVINFHETGYYTFLSTTKTQRLSITGGISFLLSKNVSLYLGAGYSTNKVLWEINKFNYYNIKIGQDWVENPKESYSFLEAETGLWIKIKPVFISFGVSSCGKYWIDGTVSAGIVF